jgi:O-antigen ligase
MVFQKSTYQFYIAAILFFVCIVLFVFFQSPYILIVPFIWILVPIIFDFCIKRTANLFWLLILALPISTELNITSSLGIDFPDEILMMGLTGLVILKMIHQPQWFPSNLIKEPLILLVCCIMGWTFISACFAENSMLSLKFFLARIWFIIPFVIVPQIVLQSQSSIRKFALLLLVPMFLMVLQALIRHSFYGFNFIDIKKAMNPFFRNHVNYSSMLVCLLVPAITMRYLTSSNSRYRKWLTIAIVIGLIGLFFSYSRGAWVAMVVGIVFALLMKWGWVKKTILIFLVALIAASSWLMVDYHFMRFAPDHDHTIFHTDFSDHIAATVSLKDVSNAERFYRWVAGYRMFVERPVTGFGPNNFYPNYRPYTINVFQTWVSDNPEHSTIHNYFLLTLAEQGVPGLLLFVLLWIAMLFRLQYLYKNLQSNFYRNVTVCVAVVLAMMASINFMSDMIETDKIGSLFWICLGFVFIFNRKLQEERNSIA